MPYENNVSQFSNAIFKCFQQHNQVFIHLHCVCEETWAHKVAAVEDFSSDRLEADGS